MAVLDKLGGSVPEKPSSFGKRYHFPEDLTVITSQQLGSLLSKLGAFKSYSLGRLGYAELKVLEYDDLMYITKLEIMKKKGGGQSRTALKEDAHLHPRVRRLFNKVVYWKKSAKRWQTLVNIYDSQIYVVSREISRRKEDET